MKNLKISFIVLALCWIISSCSDESTISPGESQNSETKSDKYVDGTDINDLAKYPFEITDVNSLSSARVGGNIVDEVIKVHGVAPKGWEADHSLSAGYILSGVGLTVTGDNVSLMVLEKRYLNSNGTLGTRHISRHGSKAHDHSWGIEQFIQVPNGRAITGIEVWCKRDRVYKIRVYSRAINSSRRLYGQYLAHTAGYHMPDLERIIKTEFYSDLSLPRSVITGLGVRVESDDFKGLKAYIGTMR